ncbi:MAG: NnrS family protein [Polyangiaceae bacterium]|nr:NnrS family protein [Polyangiaceae bacterium]MCW5791975.1 NnrS family protein [Polyangiaceae bacterium]
MFLPIEDLTAPAAADPRPAWLRKGFRPFFLGAALFTWLTIPAWALSFTGHAPSQVANMGWHAHEMLFGFTAAVIAGFLLTAVTNWTQRDTVTGYPLLAVFLLWVLGRVVWLLPDLSPALRAVVDGAFLPVVAIAIARPILAAKNTRNLPMVGILALLSIANIAWHVGIIMDASVVTRRAQMGSLAVILLLIVIMSGRVFPMFTRNGIRDPRVEGSPRADKLSAALMLLVVLGEVTGVIDAWPKLAAGLFGVLTISLVWRSLGWRTHRTSSVPLVWVLHAAHLWLIIGVALRGLSALGLAPATLALHALTVGCLVTVCFGMMARVSLGHTGRMLSAPTTATACFWLLMVASWVRVLGPLVAPTQYFVWVLISGTLLSLAALAFVIGYAVVLTSPRVDGRPE